MNYQDFCNEVKIAVQASLGDDHKVRLEQTDKLNGLTLISLVILKKGETVTPNIYLEAYYSEYQISRQISVIAEKIISIYKTADKKPVLSTCLLSDFNTVKDQLYYKLINQEKNIAFLKNVPHIKWMDLAVIFCILVKKDSEGIGSITVNNDLMERWRVTVDTLYSTASSNTPLLFESMVKPMDEIIKTLVFNQDPKFGDDNYDDTLMADIVQVQHTRNHNQSMYVAGNKSGLNGAAWLLQMNEVHNLSKSLGNDLFILPSSIHEVIVVPFTKDISQNDLYQMVREVNATQVAPEEFLSDNVYLYKMEDDTLTPLY